MIVILAYESHHKLQGSHTMDNSASFFPTERLKIVMEEKGIRSYIPEDGRDPNPQWDDVARALWPSTLESQNHREALATQLMWGSYDDVVAGAAPEAAIIMARMVLLLCGKSWMDNWILYNEGTLRRRIKLHKKNFGSEFKIHTWFKKMFKG